MEHRQYPQIGEQLYIEKLANGLSIFAVPKAAYHKSFAFYAVDYGGVDRRFNLSGTWIDTPQGVAHFLEHEMFDMEYGDALTKLSSNGANPNAFTSSDITAYYFECTEKFDENLDTLLSFVSTPYFSDTSVVKEQGIIGQEIRMGEDDPDYNVYYNLMKSLFRHNPVRDSVAGTIESISQITPQTLYDCHKVFYHPSNMALCVSGNVDISQVIEIAERILPKDPGENPGRDYGQAEDLKPEEYKVIKAMEVSQPMFIAGCKSIPAPKGIATQRQDIISAIALDILAGHSSPLYIRLYGEGLVYSDFSASYDASADVAYTLFGGESSDPERVFDEVNKEIEKLSDTGPDSGLFQRTLKASIGSYVRSLNSLESICVGIANGHFLGFDALTGLDILKSIKEEEITNFYRSHLSPQNMAISIVVPK
ncbi:MAG: insulinase family protein [Oscillospiraceae bacterium]|nr:insulinase family protein [Oscillospiraceae bacterium]